MTEVLTITQAGHLADLIRGVEQGKKLEWYPDGAHGEPRKLELVLRAFTTADHNLYDFKSDIRDAHVWCSGVFERWLPVRDLVAALQNAVDGTDLGKPMAVIREVTA